ncbi:MAG: hypothetical protein WAT14_03105, partial [Chitinophagaceae bacterium]
TGSSPVRQLRRGWWCKVGSTVSGRSDVILKRNVIYETQCHSGLDPESFSKKKNEGEIPGRAR